MKKFKKLLYYFVIFIGIILVESLLSYFLSRIGWKIIEPYNDNYFLGFPIFCLMGLILILFELTILFFGVRFFTKDRIVLIFALIFAFIHYMMSVYSLYYCCCIYVS
jgi:hypothetical protein